MLSLLKLLSEEQLHRLNKKVCEQFQKELSDRMHHEKGVAVIDEVDPFKKRFRVLQEPKEDDKPTQNSMQEPQPNLKRMPN